MLTAPLIEIFSSLQGEGPHVGEAMTFVRFQDCEFSCKFCDTPLSFIKNKQCRVEWPPFSKKFEKYPNPITIVELGKILQRFSDTTLSITGGEPLQHVPFLKEWLSSFKKSGPRKILLETAGIHWQELEKIVGLIDIVSMDLKLPSSTGMKSYWEEHRQFLKIAQSKEVYVKIVITEETTDEDLERGASLLKAYSGKIPCILQPASAFGSFRKIPTPAKIHQNEKTMRSLLGEPPLGSVRVIPQLHKQLGIL
ncbi:MAG: 7-carboxy-7-deazaguanine synthase QueE [Deltaproteobacteria bacterium]|nr:7-carboxy-7-deazaguanine synthase QueE [Deltaproteobacteria bacterium]